jgi:N utilization substance protein A
MQSPATYARPELLQVADTVARDKGIDRDEVLVAMEQAIQKAGRSKYGQEYDIRAEIDRKNGEIRLMRFREVKDPVENEATQIPLVDARRFNPEA